MFCEMGRYLRRDSLFPGIDLPNRIYEFGGGHVLEQITSSPCFQGTMDFHIALKSGQHNYQNLRKFVSDSHQRVNTAHVRKAEVHQGDVGLMLLELLNGFETR